MCKKLHLKLKVIFIIVIALCTVLLFSVGLQSNVVAEHLFESTNVLLDEYLYGQTIEIPSASFGEYSADTVITAPNGNAYLTNKITLNYAGVYIVEYRKEINGKLYSEKKTFNVIQKAYNFSKYDSNSSVTYGKDENNQWSQWNSEKEGLLVSIAKGESFVYNKVFNLKQTSKDNPAIKFSLTPSTKGASDAEYMYVTFTDVYDKDNKIEYLFKLSNGQQEYTYVCARAKNQVWVGNEGTKWHINNPYGTPIYFTPGGYLSATNMYDERINTVKDQSISLYYNAEENYAQIAYTYFNRDWGTLHAISDIGVSDFDNLSVQENPWAGLTTGEVYCTVSFDGYKGAFANIIIEELGGFDLEDDECNPTDGADIEVDTLGYDLDELPKAKVGYKYPVFNCKALDKYAGRQLTVETRVFYNYSRSTGSYYGFSNVNYLYEVGIENGKFATDNEGRYAICYRVIDTFGVAKEYVIEINSIKNLSLPIMETISIEDDKKIASQLVGNIVDIPDVVDFGGGFGGLIVNAEVKFDDAIYCATKKEWNEGYYFIPKKAGVYTVCIYAEDFYGQRAEIEYDVTISPNNFGYINEFVSIPKYLIEQDVYVLPNLNINKEQKLNAKIMIIDGLGEREYNGQGVYFLGDDNGNAVIRYYVGESYYDYVRPVIKVREGYSLKVDKYFYSEDLTVRNTASGIGLLSYSNDGSAEFIRDLVDGQVSIASYVNAKRNEFNRVSYYLTDSQDCSISVKLTFENNGSSVKLYINDKDIKLSIATANFNNSSMLMIEYKSATQRVSFAGAREMPIENTLYGEMFNGFPSGKVNIRLAVEKVYGKAEIFVTKINNQDFNKWVSEDKVTPQITFKGSFSQLYYYIGDTFTVLPTIQDDVLSTYTYTCVTVTYDDNPITDTDGKVLKNVVSDKYYLVKFKEIGEYNISYVTVDSAGNSYVYSFNLKVKDSEAPVITIDGKVPTIARLGVVELPSFTVSDNLTKDCVKYITLTGPNNYMVTLTNNSFTATMAGKYIVSYYAMDDEGNTSIKTYTITVS